MGRGSSKAGRSGNTSAFTPKAGQREFEERWRNAKIEHGAYLDGEGNILLEATGTSDYVDFDYHEVNHKVEQRIWNDEEVNFTHNHPINTVFSPDDIDIFEQEESHSTSAVCPNGMTYRLIRNQPRTSHVWVDGHYTFEPKKIAGDYDAEYRRFLSLSDRSTHTDSWYEHELTPHMASWLRQNASSYGYIFVEERK